MDNAMRELIPLTAAALAEEAWFDAAQSLAAKRGWEFARSSTGYRVSCANTTRHYIGLREATEFVRSLPGANHA